MGLLSSKSKSSSKVTNYNTSASGAVQAGSGASTNLSGLNLSTGAGGKNAAGGALSVTLTDQGALANAYDVADRSFSSIETALAGVAEFASSSLDRVADAFKTSSAQSLSAYQAANDFTSDAFDAANAQSDRAGGTIDAQKIVYAVLAVIAVGAAAFYFKGK